MRCNYCHTEIIEFIIHEKQNPKGRIIRRYECECCGPVDEAPASIFDERKPVFKLKG